MRFLTLSLRWWPTGFAGDFPAGVATTQWNSVERSTHLFVILLVAGIGTVMGVVPMFAHHLIEHTFDFLIPALILAAVLRSKPTTFGIESPTTQGESRDNQ